MKVATWNINSVRARLPNLLDWLAKESPDIVCLQEIKCKADQFPLLDIQAAGYSAHIVGQKAYNGVAVLSRVPVRLVQSALPNAPDDAARYIEVETLCGLRVAGVYVPNGNPMGTEKYTYKSAWLKALNNHVQGLLTARKPLIICGDFNIIPDPVDCYDPAAWVGDALFQPDVRNWYKALLYSGFTDAFKARNPMAKNAYTFWDYQGGAWQHNHGIRIDHLLLNPEAADRLKDVFIDKNTRALDKASDHVPVWVKLVDGAYR